VALAQLDVRKNPIVASIVAKQNDMALEAARRHLAQLEQNLANRKKANDAAIAIQEAGHGKAGMQADTARRNIEAMTLRAKRDGYVSVKQNSSGNFFFFGMTLPLYQVGDTVRPGMAVAEIPDLKNWEIGANIGELDRGHLSTGEQVAITIVALPTHKFNGHVKELGGTNGPPWDRRFECKIALDDPSPELRPGMSVQLIVTTDEMRNVLWLPAQALFESDGRTYVYVSSGTTFTPKDVKLIRRNETRVIIEGLQQGQTVALANPIEMKKKTDSKGALQAIPR
jgi:HlyD family secretion protein